MGKRIKPSCLVEAIFLLWLASGSPVLGAPGPAADGDDRLAAAGERLTAGRLDEAEQLYRELIAADPQQVAPYRGLAEVYVARGRPDAAVELILQVARKLIPSRRFIEALEPLERAAALAPEEPEVHLLLGRALAEERRYPSAAAAYERALELGQSSLETLLYLAACYWESERFDAAEATYELARTSHGDSFGLSYHHGQFLLWQGRAADAVAPLARAAAAAGDRPEVIFHLARAKAESGDPEGAIAAYERVLELDPGHQRAHHALELLRRRGGADAGTRPAPADGGSRTVVFTAAAEPAGIDFRHQPGVSERRHLPETMGAGLAWLDYDGDGWWDLYLVQSGPFPPDGSAAAANRLFRNRGRGTDGRVTFEDVTARTAAGERSYGQGAIAADVDGDGDVDLYLTHVGLDVLLSNRGDGTFADRTAAGLDGVDGWSSSAALADADADGDLDLYVSRYVDYDPAHRHRCDVDGRPEYCNAILFSGVDDRLYRQRDDGSFEDVTSAAGLAAGGRGLGVVWTDLDGDRRPDLYVANDLDPNRLYRNLSAAGGIRFEDVSLLSGAAFNGEGEAEAGMGVAAGDLDGDGLPELLVTNFDAETNTLYRNLGELAFTDVAAASGFALPSFNRLGFGIALADFDGDGDLDAYVANGHVFERPRRETTAHAQPDLLLLGDGQANFHEQRLRSAPRIGRGAAVADYDADGDPDVAVQDNRGPAELWRNDSARRRWLGIELVGHGRNTQAIGARVRLLTVRPEAAGDETRAQVRQVMAGGSYQSSADRRLLFAWPREERPQELEVRWPGGGKSRLRQPPEGRYLRLVEPTPAAITQLEAE